MPAHIEEQYRFSMDSQNKHHSVFVVDACGLHAFELSGQSVQSKRWVEGVEGQLS